MKYLIDRFIVNGQTKNHFEMAATPAEQTAPPSIEIDSLYPTPEALAAQPIDNEILAQFNDHYFLKRGIFNAQIDIKEINDHPFYVYLQFSPNNRLTHLRHFLFLKFAKDIQEMKNCYIIVHVTDTKSLLRDPKAKWADIEKFRTETVKDILAFNFDPVKTLIIFNTDAPELDYIMLCDLQRSVPLGDFVTPLYPDDSVNVGLIDTAFQSAAIALPSYLTRIFGKNPDLRCLMLCRSSQKAFVDFTRHLADISKDPKPAVIYGGFVPALQSREKMPKIAKIALVGNKTDYMTIYLKNTAKEVTQKLNKFAFSGGRDRKEDQQETGANLAVDIPFYYLKLFADDETFEHVRIYYGPGELQEGNEKRLLTGEVKKLCGEIIWKAIKPFQDGRNKVTPDLIKQVCTIHPLV